MKIGVIGLGKMGCAIAYRLCAIGYSVFGFDLDALACKDAKNIGVNCVASYEELIQQAEVVWLMVPAGNPVDNILQALLPILRPGSIIIDGGNSKFTDSIRRAEQLKKRDVLFLDCGTSGGLHGKNFGFSLMIGGDQQAFEQVKDIFSAVAAHHGYAYVGPSGAGHYVKMIHNGIEYALLQAYAEGFHILKEGLYKNLDMEKITQVWLHGSVIRSWILELAHNVFKDDQKLAMIVGEIGGGSTGEWMVQEAHKYNIPVRLIEDALTIRKESYKTGGNYATKLVALLREQFGGHEVKRIKA